MRNIGILSLFIVILFSCSEELNTKEFYFKPSDFRPAKTYKFQSLENPLKIEYWKISNIGKNEILTVRNNTKGQLIDELKEKLSEKGSILTSYKRSFTGGEWIMTSEFYPKERELMKWDLKEKSNYDGEFVINGIIWNLKREREFLEITELKFDSDNYETLIFKDKYFLKPLSNPNQNLKEWLDKTVNNFIQYSYFAKGIGLVKYKREYDNGEIETMELVEIN